jgi:predicted ATPase/DNA-binding CsgD family transcriptional regulator
VSASPTGLPRSVTSFVGRTAECEQVGAALLRTRLLVLTGPGGAGKTRLALEVAGRCSASFSDGVWWVDLAPIADPALVGDTVARALGVRPLPGRTAIEAVVDRLGSDRALIVLDNGEHVRDAAADVCAAVIRGCPGVTVLATSREVLGAVGESDWSVPPLTLPAEGLGLVTAATVWSSDAGRVFVERARAARAGFELDDGNAAVVARICRELDGIPLALELAAARVRMLSVEQIAERLGDRFGLLSAGPRGVAERQRTLRQSVDWSHDLLAAPERVLFRRLAVFAGGWSLEAAETVCADPGLSATAVFDVLGSLVAKSLALVEEHHGVVRYRFLETVRQYALELLDRAGELAVLRDRHLDYFLGLAEQAAVELETPRNLAWLKILDPDAANIEAAILHGVGHAPEKALRLSIGVTMWWNMRGRFAAGQSALERVVAAAPETGRWQARGLWSRGHLASYRGDYGTAVASFEQALALAVARGDHVTRARAVFSLAALGLSADPRGARAALRQAVELARGVGDEWAVMSALTTLAWSHLMTDEYAAAELLFVEAAPAVQRTGLEGAAWTSLGRGWCALAGGDCAAARAGFEEAVFAARRLGDPVTEGFGRVLLTRLDLMQGEVGRAVERAQAGEADAVAAGAFMVLPSTRTELARAYAMAGRCDDARTILEGLVASRVDEGWMLGEALLALAEVTSVLGDVDQARTHADRALALSRRLGAGSLGAAANEALARLAIAQGEWQRAGVVAREALDQRVAATAIDRLPQSLGQLAQVAAGLGSFRDAARLLAAADRGRAELGIVRPVFDAPALASLEEVLRARLGVDAFEAARAEGERMSVAEAVGWVRRARGSRKRPTHGWPSLTPTESRVVELVAMGLTNPQIAERMFVSRATVKAHLAHVFAKLCVGSRAEVAAMAARQVRARDDER